MPRSTSVAGASIRPFQRGDIPALVALRRRMFRHSEQASDQALAAHFQAVFHAWRGGAVALEGRVEPALLPALADQGSRLVRQGAWMLCDSPHPAVELAIQRGDAFLSRLEGEWWVSF